MATERGIGQEDGYYANLRERLDGALANQDLQPAMTRALAIACYNELMALGTQNLGALKAYTQNARDLEEVIRSITKSVQPPSEPRTEASETLYVQQIARNMASAITGSDRWAHAGEVRLNISEEGPEEGQSRPRGGRQAFSRESVATHHAAYERLHQEHTLKATTAKSFEEVSRENPVMVFANPTKEAIVFDAMHQYVAEKAVGKGIHEILTQEHAEPMNRSVNEAIKKSLQAGDLVLIEPKAEAGGAKKYEHATGGLTQVEQNGMFTFTPDAKFTGVVRVQRRSENGKLDPTQVDVVEYKDGKPIAVCMATTGKCRIKDIGLLRDQAMGQGKSSRVKVRVLLSKPVVEPAARARRGSFSAPDTPGKSNPHGQHGTSHG